MKNFFNKIKNYGFWVSLSASLIMLLNALGNAFGFSIENQIVEDCIMSVAGVLVVLGVVTMNTNKTENNNEDIETLPEDEENQDDN